MRLARRLPRIGRGLVGGLALLVVLAGCGLDGSAAPPTATASGASPESVTPARAYPAGSLAAVLQEDGRFAVFLGLLESDAFLLDRLLGEPQRTFTLFAPSDEAFAFLNAETLAALRTDPGLVTGIVERHFLPRRLPAADFTSSWLFTGMSRRASRLSMIVDGQRVLFGDAMVLETDIAAGGGIVHVIDSVNLGPTPDRVPIP